MLRSLKSIRGFKLAATGGEVGKIREIYFDDHSWTVRYFVVETGGWFTGRDVLIAPRSLGTVDGENGTVGVHLSQEQIRDSPPIESEKPISRRYEEAYYAYYGWEPYWAAPDGAPAFSIPAQAATPPTERFAGYEESMRNREPEPKEDTGDPHLRSSSEVSGYAIHAKDGHIGHLDDFIVDDEEWRIRYLVVDTRNWLPGKLVLVSPEWINTISFLEREIYVSVDKEAIKGAPEYDPDLPINRALEGRLYEHHGYHAYWEGIHAARLRR